MDYDAFELAYPLLYAKFVTEKVSTSFETKVRKGINEMEVAYRDMPI